MDPNIIKMYQERFTEFLNILKNDIYPESVPMQAKFSCTDEPVPFSKREYRNFLLLELRCSGMDSKHLWVFRALTGSL